VQSSKKKVIEFGKRFFEEMRNCLKKFVVESCIRRRAHSSLAALPARDDVKRSLSSSNSNSKVFTDGKYGAATTTRRSLGFANELSFFRDIGDRSVLHHQLPCSWTSKSFTSAKNLAGDENDDSPVTGNQRYCFSYWRIFHLRVAELIPSLAV
jgi:hypothetical protein